MAILSTSQSKNHVSLFFLKKALSLIDNENDYYGKVMYNYAECLFNLMEFEKAFYGYYSLVDSECGIWLYDLWFRIGECCLRIVEGDNG